MGMFVDCWLHLRRRWSIRTFALALHFFRGKARCTGRSHSVVKQRDTAFGVCDANPLGLGRMAPGGVASPAREFELPNRHRALPGCHATRARSRESTSVSLADPELS